MSESWWRTPSARPWVFLACAALLGVVAGGIWRVVVRLPTFTMNANLQAVPTPERELSAWFAIDSWFSIIGLALGLGLGVWAWFWFNRRGWLVIAMAMLGAGAAALCCMGIGAWLGPENFDVRLARASVGEQVPIAFELRSLPALLLWLFAAITPIMVLAAFSPDSDEDAPASAPTMSE